MDKYDELRLLLDIEKSLKYRYYNALKLENLQRLKDEVQRRLKAIIKPVK
jgi:hypothetical protein